MTELQHKEITFAIEFWALAILAAVVAPHWSAWVLVAYAAFNRFAFVHARSRLEARP